MPVHYYHIYHLQNNDILHYLSLFLYISYHFGRNTTLFHHHTTNSLTCYQQRIVHFYSHILLVLFLFRLYISFHYTRQSHIYHLQSNGLLHYPFLLRYAFYRFGRNTMPFHHHTTSWLIYHYHKTYLFHIHLLVFHLHSIFHFQFHSHISHLQNNGYLHYPFLLRYAFYHFGKNTMLFHHHTTNLRIPLLHSMFHFYIH